ncbi:MAG: aldolase/citrate lyase family protein, partial [Proteobacteria bacterium]|nr:aldolase/citrate lyase family protein [Pseudomonadota bacterium]
VTSAQEMSDATEHSGSTRLLLPLIESLGALEALDDILAIDGISGVFIGCTDLAEVLGHPLDYLHPEVLAAVEKACKLAKTRGKIVLANTGYAFPSIEGCCAREGAEEVRRQHADAADDRVQSLRDREVSIGRRARGLTRVFTCGRSRCFPWCRCWRPRT